MKKSFLGIVSAIVLIIIIFTVMAPIENVDPKDKINEEIPAGAYLTSLDIMSTPYRQAEGYLLKGEAFQEEGAAYVDQEGCLILEKGTGAQCKLDISEPGTYRVVFDVFVSNSRPVDNKLIFQIKGNGVNSQYVVVLPVRWVDESKTYVKDRYNNETIPDQVKLSEFVQDAVRRGDTIYGEELVLELAAGEYEIALYNEMEKTAVRSVLFEKEREASVYDVYRERYNQEKNGEETIIIEAENYCMKSDSYIAPGTAEDMAVHPYNIDFDYINILDGASCSKPGQQVSYLFQVSYSGLYSMGFTYAQRNAEDMSCYRNVKIDGESLFKEMETADFPYTQLSYKNKMLCDENGVPRKVFLEAGEHVLTLEATITPYQEVLERLWELMEQIRQLSLDIKKVTGNSTDRYRTWNMEEYIPDISDTLQSMAEEVDGIYLMIGTCCGREPSFASTLTIAGENLRMLAEDPDKLPDNMTLFSDGSSSVSQRLAEVMDILLDQNVDIDRIYLLGGEEGLFDTEVSGFQILKAQAIQFAHSFAKESQGYSSAKSHDSEKLIVWMNRPLQYVTLLQQMADTDFTEKTGIPVEIYIMPNEQKLVLSNATGSNPDVALSVANQTPYNLALRGAAYPLSEFEDFYSYMKEDYNLAAYAGLILENKVYGTLETSDFYVMVYRKDIFEALQLDVPQTWDDVIGMMPKLLRYGMSFYTPIAGNKGSKYLHETVPYLFQAGAEIMAGDGLSVDFTSEEAYKGFELMTDLYLKYSLSQDTPNFYNNFRYGTTPVGIVNYSTYILLKNAAPEIQGEWEMALVPGTLREDGSICRYQVAGDKSDLIFANSEKKEEGWEFLKWWLSQEVQLKYAIQLMTHYGSEYFWNTSNMKAFENYPMDSEEISVVLEQWKLHTKELQKHPATYMIEREISNVWSAVVVNGADLRTTLVQTEIAVNREMQMKLKEFGYISDKGEVLKEYPVLSEEELLQLFLGVGSRGE